MNYSKPYLDYCNALPFKLTSLRKAVLYLLWTAEKPLKAYDILHDLIKIKPNATPPTVYRALDFFVAQGCLHKIESIQSYTLCCEPIKQQHSEMLLVCNNCHHVTELYDADFQTMLSTMAEKQHFKINADAIEIKGLCKRCVN